MLVGEEKHCDTGSAAKNGYSLLPHAIIMLDSLNRPASKIRRFVSKNKTCMLKMPLRSFRSIHQFTVQIETNAAFTHGAFCLAAEVPGDWANGNQDDGWCEIDQADEAG